MADRRQFLRARLFDMWLGDWSRREDQWRWAVFLRGDRTLFQAIPRDRDHAFFKFNDGLLTWLGSKIKTNYQTFGYRVKNVKGLNKSAAPLDNFLLAGLSREDFKQVADSLQQALTDAVIHQATRVWPENIYKLTGREFEAKLKTRREQLPQLAVAYYQQLAKHVALPGTDNADHFIIQRLDDTHTRVQVFAPAEADCPGARLFDRTFNQGETNRISLYGLDGPDTFTLSGVVDQGIEIRLYDGQGEDKILDTSRVSSLTRKTRILDAEDGNQIQAGPRTKVKKHNHPLAKEFNGGGWLLRHRLH
jgi:hypothetical protein